MEEGVEEEAIYFGGEENEKQTVASLKTIAMKIALRK